MIRDRNENEISSAWYDLPDFEDESKYVVRLEDEEGTDRIVSMDFTFGFEDGINFDEISVEQGCIFYRICLVEDDYQIITVRLNCGINCGFLYFVKSDEQIEFSQYDNIFHK